MSLEEYWQMKWDQVKHYKQLPSYYLKKERKSVIVTPTSLIYNWKSEFEKFAPNLNIKIIHGNKEERIFTKEYINEYDVLLTTYGTLRNDYNLYEDIILIIV